MEKSSLENEHGRKYKGLFKAADEKVTNKGRLDEFQLCWCVDIRSQRTRYFLLKNGRRRNDENLYSLSGSVMQKR